MYYHNFSFSVIYRDCSPKCQSSVKAILTVDDVKNFEVLQVEVALSVVLINNVVLRFDWMP